MGVKMSMFFYDKFLLRGLSKESAVVLLAFISTALVYGFIIYSYSSLYRGPSLQPYSVSSVGIFYSDGSVWRLDIPVSVSGDSLDVRSLRLEVSVGRSVLPLFSSGYVVRVGDRVIYGSLIESLTSGKVLVLRDGRELTVELFVYIDFTGRYNVVVDDDFDGVLDNEFLIRFYPGVQLPPLNLGSDEVLVVSKGSTVSLDCLNMLAFTSKPNAYIRVVDGGTQYLVRVVDLISSLRFPTVLISSSSDIVKAGGEVIVTVLFPTNLVSSGSQLSIKLLVGDTKVVDTLINIPSGISGVVVLPIR